MNQWFICSDEKVLGPFTADELKNEIKLGKVQRTTLVWGTPMNQWKSAAWWEAELNQMNKVRKLNSEARPWYYAIDGEHFGPFPRPKFIAELKKVDTKDNEILVWTKGMTTWVSIFEFTDLMEEVGISRRQHPRASIKGSVVVKTFDKALLGKIVMISQGGCGITGIDGLKTGEKISIDIKAAVFPDPIRARAEVRYISDSGYVGLKFDQLQAEVQAQIVTYVKQEVEPAKRAA